MKYNGETLSPTSPDDEISHDAYWYFGGIASATAVLFTHPIDLVRVQMQSRVQRMSARQASRLIMKYGGMWGFYYAVGSSMQRQLSYAATRFGIYETAKNHGLVDSFWRKVQVASLSGLIAGWTNTPLEKVNVRMRTDAAKMPRMRRNYANGYDGVRQLYARGGFMYLYKAGLVSSVRGMVLNVGQLSIYDQVKEQLLANPHLFTADSWRTFFIASLIAGGIATIFTTPIDIIKTISMEATLGKYHGNLDIIRALLAAHGPMGLFKGIVPSFCRIVPQTTLTFLIYEELRYNFGK